MHVLLGPGQLELSRYDGHGQGGATGTSETGEDGNAPAAVSVWHNITVADREEGDGRQPHGVEQIGVLLVVVSIERCLFGWVGGVTQLALKFALSIIRKFSISPLGGLAVRSKVAESLQIKHES